MVYMTITRVYPSIPTRVHLTPEEWNELHEVKIRTGIPLGRLVADAVRAVHLGKKPA